MRNLRVWLTNGYWTIRQKVCIPSKDERKSTKDVFYLIEEYMQNVKHPNILFPKYNLE